MIKWITNKDQLLKHKDLVDQFFTLYEHEDNFPDVNEREEPKYIKDRILENSTKPNTNLIAYVTSGILKGGAIIEYYPKSQCCLITYIFVNKSDRKSGIAKKILKEDKINGIPGFIDHLRDKGNKVKAVFFETNNPFLTEESKDSMMPYERLNALYKLDSKRIDFNYIQPSLDSSKNPVKNLYLCLFPKLGCDEYIIEIKLVLCFLTEFYYSLDALQNDFEIEFNKSLNLQNQQAPNFYTAELNEMYKSLIANDDGLQGFAYLKQLPRIEQPRISFNRASVCCEILIDETQFSPYVVNNTKKDSFPQLLKKVKNGVDPMATHNSNDRYCSITHSFETDLFAYSYQAEQPYYTRSFNFPSFTEVVVRFPQMTEYTSEGRQETLYVLPIKNGIQNPKVKKVTSANERIRDRIVKELKLNVFLNYTYFFNSEIRVWHLIFASSEEHPIDEIDLIKLMKFFSGSQESKSENAKKANLQNIKFVNPKAPEKEMSMIELFTEVSGIKYTKHESQEILNDEIEPISINNINTGIVAIDSKYCSFPNEVSSEKSRNAESALVQLFKNLKNNEERQKVNSSDVERQYQSNSNAEFVFKTFCGITLGIFDYDRMSFEEVSDTIIPRSTTESSFLTINRGVLSSFGYNDNVFSASNRSLGMNPYLLVPSAVLAQNEYIANDAFSKSKLTLDKLHTAKKIINVRELEIMRKHVRSLLNIDFLPNVFQYATEQDLYNYGMHHRGVLEKVNRTKANLEQIDDIINESNSQLNHRYQFWVNVLLMIISIFQIYEVVANLIIEVSSPKLELNVTFVKIVVLVFLIIVCTYIATRLYRKSAIDTSRKFILKE